MSGSKRRDAPSLLLGPTLNSAALFRNENTLNKTTQAMHLSRSAAEVFCPFSSRRPKDAFVSSPLPLRPRPPLTVHQGQPKYSLPETPHRSADMRRHNVDPGPSAKVLAQIWQQLFFTSSFKETEHQNNQDDLLQRRSIICCMLCLRRLGDDGGGGLNRNQDCHET